MLSDSSSVGMSVHGRNAREYISNVLTNTDPFSVTDSGNFCVEGYDALELLETHGSPLFVVSEKTIRANYRRILEAFTSRWPRHVVVMYAIKANNNPAIRAIIHQEGGGSDCFGLGELHATFEGGADPALVALNGSNKGYDDLCAAVRHGIMVNIDSLDEIEMLSEICARSSTVARVAIRLKSAPRSLSESRSDYLGVESQVQLFLLREKWGFSEDAAVEIIEIIQNKSTMQLCGFHLHTPRFTQNPNLFAECTREFAEIISNIYKKTGFAPQIIDIGGGWPRKRDPESRKHAMNPYTIDDFAEAVVHSILGVFGDQRIPLPELRLEPGRYIVGNAVTLLGRVGAIKRDFGMTWVNADFSTNNLVRVDTSGSAYHVVVASGMDRSYVEKVQIVGPTCIDSRIADDWPVPDLHRGEPIAVLDAGMYAESTATQFNSVPRPATVLVGERTVDVIRQRETVEDVFAKTSVPDRLRTPPANVVATPPGGKS